MTTWRLAVDIDFLVLGRPAQPVSKYEPFCKYFVLYFLISCVGGVTDERFREQDGAGGRKRYLEAVFDNLARIDNTALLCA